MKRQKTIVVNYLGRKGAGPVFSYEMTKGLKNNGCKVYAIISKYSENLNAWKELGLDGLQVIPTYNSVPGYLINTIKFKLFGVRKLKKYFKNIPVDAVYSPMNHSWTGLVNSIFPKSQKIITLHDPIPHSGTKLIHRMRKNNAKIIKDADDIVILSKVFKDYVIEKFQKKEENVHIIPHGVFDYYKNFESNEKVIDYDPKKYNFLFFGRITKYKGLHVLAQAYKKLSQEYDNISLTVVGNGDFEDYREAYNELKNVTIVNRWIKDEEVGSFFKGDNIITVLPYLDATQSGVIPIAMEYESVVIASNTGGLSEQVMDKETGYLFETGNSDDLYRKMKYVIENYDNQGSIIDNARKYIKSLSWDALAGELIKIIRQDG